ncbi:Leu/Ile/Val-binding protein [Anaerolineae bacterium]|nr:Leu/Ile/Val-binding protein [Anaerolineae bacterium]
MKRTILFVLAALVVALAACTTPTAAPQPTTAPAQPAATNAPAQPAATKPAAATGEPIKIAIIGAFSGTNAVLGDWMKKGVTLAVEERNAAGGIHGRPISIIIYDDEADPTKSVNLAQKVATDDKVVAAWATTNSTSALADIPIFKQYKIVQLTNGTNVDITNKGSEYVFRSCPAGVAYEVPLVEFLVKTKGFKKLAIITDTSAYGKGEADYQEAALKTLGLQALTRETYGIDDKDFTGQLTKILATNPEVILFGGSEIASGLIAKQARQLGFKGQLAGGPAIGTPKFIETAGNDIAEGVFFTGAYPTNDLNDMTRAFAKRYAARWNGEEAEIHGANTYDGTQMLMMAMDKAYPNLTGEAIAAAFHTIKDYKGLQGTFNVAPNGETLTSTLLGVIKGGKLTLYQQ